jgi:6-phosphogluconolactonase
VLPSDERCVPLGHAESNETMIRQALITQKANNANLVSIYDGQVAASDACKSLGQKLENLPLPFTAVLLGMGVDGHFASLFPGPGVPQQGLDPDGEECCLVVETAASLHPRISLTLSTLLRSKEILLLFFGEAKRQVFSAARQGDRRYPVSHLVDQQRTPVHVFWAPLPDE